MMPSDSPRPPRSEVAKLKWFTEGVNIFISKDRFVPLGKHLYNRRADLMSHILKSYSCSTLTYQYTFMKNDIVTIIIIICCKIFKNWNTYSAFAYADKTPCEFERIRDCKITRPKIECLYLLKDVVSAMRTMINRARTIFIFYNVQASMNSQKLISLTDKKKLW